MITSPSGRRYIGQTGNVKKRKHLYKYLRCKKQKLLYNSLNKYGFSAHSFEIIDIVEDNQANNAEIHWIQHHKTYWLDKQRGLNLTRGGQCAKFTPEIRQKISKSLLGSKNIKAKKLYQYNLDGSFVKEWECMKCIERELGFFTTWLSKAAKSNGKAYDYLWSYNPL